MSDFEYFSTIGAFVAGFVFLIYLFRVRAKVIRRFKIRVIQAKAKVHEMTRLSAKEADVWEWESGRQRDIR